MSTETNVAPSLDDGERIAKLGACERVLPHRKPARLSLRWSTTILLSDVLAFVVSAYVGIEVVVHVHPVVGVSPTFVTAGIIIALQMVLFERLGLYRRTLASSTRDELYLVTAALTIGALPLLVFFTLVPEHSTSRLVILSSLALSIGLVGGTRAVLHELRTISEQRKPRRIAIVGRPDRTAAASASLNAVVGTEILRIPVDDLDASVALMRGRANFDLGSLTWFTEARRWGCEMLLLTETLPPWVLPLVLAAAAREHIKVAFAPPRFQVHAYSVRLEIDGEQALIVPTQLRACTPPAQFCKRGSDIVLSSLALALTLPLLLACALAIALESRGPVFFRQARVGRNGRIFEVLKLRSMRLDAERATGPVWAQRGDTRVTRVGRFLRRFSLDELPQLVNVLRGDMSIVGPRPERPEFVAEFQADIPRYDERHLVRPGITGWSQVNLSRALRPSDAAKKLSYDLFYIEQWSLFLDVYIVMKTVLEFMFHQAA